AGGAGRRARASTSAGRGGRPPRRARAHRAPHGRSRAPVPCGRRPEAGSPTTPTSARSRRPGTVAGRCSPRTGRAATGPRGRGPVRGSARATVRPQHAAAPEGPVVGNQLRLTVHDRVAQLLQAVGRLALGVVAGTTDRVVLQ